MAWVIVDMEERSKKTAEEIVLPRQRHDLKCGWFAKLRFEQNPSNRRPPPTEYIWVRLTSGLFEEKYEGVLTIDPEIVREHNLKQGSTVSFEPKNVVDFVDA